MDISIIIPCYNAEKYIFTALSSILNQESSIAYEIIIVDDGSSIAVDSIISESDKLKIVRKKNGGVSSARNVGIQHAVGRYVMFLDADDIYLPNLFSKIENLLLTNDPDVICWGFKIQEINGNTNRKVSEKLISHGASLDLFSSLLKKDIYLHLCSICVKAEFLRKNSIVF
ncbi:glycosyltransferase family 2 protein, partial [Vibrio cholerae]